ncbi:hypothetical protein [Solirubrobacter soli]|uniref:hypothetical protein n=1 Tax=Solirubrobacter soli TaxID=363832 RepID=UPI00042096E5|nr:hypothetical protein [Solirubrobacter soli]
MLRRVAKFAVVATVAAPGFSKEIGDGDVFRWTHAGGIGALIGAAWTEGEAAERQISVSDQDVTEAIAPPHDGLNAKDRRYEAKVSLLDAALKAPILQQAAQSVTQQQIDDYVTQHPKLAPEQRRVRAIEARSTQEARRIKAAIQRGLTWRAAARRYRTVVTHDVGDVNIDRAPVHTVLRFRRTVFEVTSIRPARPLPIDQQKAQAWELLAGEAQQRAANEFEQAMQAKWRPRTTCAAPASAKDFCSNSPTG